MSSDRPIASALAKPKIRSAPGIPEDDRSLSICGDDRVRLRRKDRVPYDVCNIHGFSPQTQLFASQRRVNVNADALWRAM